MKEGNRHEETYCELTGVTVRIYEGAEGFVPRAPFSKVTEDDRVNCAPGQPNRRYSQQSAEYDENHDYEERKSEQCVLRSSEG